MTTRFCVRALAGLLVLVASTTVCAQRLFYVPGQFQTPDPWTPTAADLMTETAPGSGIYELLVTGLTEGQQYGFKILEDLVGDGVDWPECPSDMPGTTCTQITPADSWFINVGTSGETTIRLDTNDYSEVDEFLPSTNRVIIEEDITTWNAFGSFQSEAGGTDFDNTDTNFTMVDQGDGLFSLTVNIDTPGNYEWRAVNTGTPAGIATDQRRTDFGDNQQFITFEENQEVTLLVDTSLGAISVDTLDTRPGDTNGNFEIEFEEDFGPIRDNFLEETFIRSEGDLNTDGIVDILDFREWKDACLAENCATTAQIASAFNSLPEPASGSLLLFALAGLAMVRRHR